MASGIYQIENQINGKRHSEETKQKISKALKASWRKKRERAQEI